MNCKGWTFLAVFQVLVVVPAVADESSVLNDLAQSHRDWVLSGHFFAPTKLLSDTPPARSIYAIEQSIVFEDTPANAETTYRNSGDFELLLNQMMHAGKTYARADGWRLQYMGDFDSVF
jgi:hypothetical protein